MSPGSPLQRDSQGTRVVSDLVARAMQRVPYVDLLLHGSLILIFLWLLVGGMGVPVPEDIAVLSIGVLIHRGAVDPVLALAVGFVGVLGGDAILFQAARRLGPRALDRPLFQHVLPPARRARIEDLFRRHGGRLVFFARHVAGFRASVFA